MTTPNPRTDLRVGLTIVSLEEGDLTEAEVDAIVNPANHLLVLGSGVAGAIKNKGGDTIQEECNRIGGIDVGQACITGAGELRARHVIHAVGPRMGEGDEDEKLASATRNALRVASENHLTSVAFPAISTGVFGFPRDRCAHIMMDTAVDFLKHEKTTVRQLFFVLYDHDTLELFQREMERHRTAEEITARRAP
ncbi:MAG: macro domain-containing protein [Armatimonadetes bacterium]|nr:macro domain-containing protein [Armatimonadota bacterium]